MNKKFANYCLLAEHSFSLRKTCVAGCVFMLSHVISVEWNWTFSSGNCRKSTDLLRVLLTTRMRMPSMPSRWSGSLSQDITPSDLTQAVAWWSDSILTKLTCLLWVCSCGERGHHQRPIYIGLWHHCVYTQLAVSAWRVWLHQRFTVYVQVPPSQPCVKSLATSKGWGSLCMSN